MCRSSNRSQHHPSRSAPKGARQTTLTLKETSICILDEAGKICREIRVASHPEDLLQILQDPAWHLERIGLEAGLLSQWLFNGLAEAGLPVVCIETRHTKLS